MELLVAPVEHITVDIEVALAQKWGAQPLPFPGMVKSGAVVCEFYFVLSERPLQEGGPM